jgi:hypothetical protein
MKLFRAMLVFVLVCGHAAAADLSSLTKGEMAGGLKETLTRSATTAVGLLGQEGGFLNNEKVKIPLPENLAKVERVMRTFGMGKQADDLVLAMNRAAEAAVPEAKKLLVDAVKKMSIDDAKAIITGGDDAATAYFRKNTEGALATRFLPIVKKNTEKVGLAQRYNDYSGKASQFGLLDKSQSNIETYVTQQALDGLYKTIAEQERLIRQDPVGQGSKLIGKIFGLVR